MKTIRLVIRILWLALGSVAISNAEPLDHSVLPKPQKHVAVEEGNRQVQKPASETTDLHSASTATDYRARLHERVTKEIPKLPLPRNNFHPSPEKLIKPLNPGDRGVAVGVHPEVPEPGSLTASKQHPVSSVHAAIPPSPKPVSTAPLNGATLTTSAHRTSPAFVGGPAKTAVGSGGGITGTGMNHKRYP